MIFFHPYFFRVHHGHTGSIVTEGIVTVRVIIGEHEVESVADIFFTQVITDGGSGYKFKVDAVPVSFHMVVLDHGMIGFP